MFKVSSVGVLLLSSLSRASIISNANTSFTLYFQNNLNATDNVNHIGFILLDPSTRKDAATTCSAIGETLLSSSSIRTYESDIQQPLIYNAYAGRAASTQSYIVQDGIVTISETANQLAFSSITQGNAELPVLCTQSSNQNLPGNAIATLGNTIAIASSGNTYIGFRNQKSFRFLGIPYANPPQRFVYSTPYSPKGQTINATAYGSECIQSGPAGSENCLFLNIQTPYLPKQGSTKDLRPVLFWIHGGGFVGGTGADPGSDGGELASREDIVVVTINYRLSTLGFLAIPGTNITGNYGIADQINALDVSCLLLIMLHVDG